MEFYEVINKRRTSREWTAKEVDFGVIKRIIATGMKALLRDYYRNGQFIVLHKRKDKEQSFAYANAVAKRYVGSHIHIGGWRS